MSGASIETTLEVWASSLRDVKARIRLLFTQERVAASASLFLDGLLGDERRKTGWMRAEAAGILARGVSRRSWAAAGGTRKRCATSYAITRWKRSLIKMPFLSLTRPAFLNRARRHAALRASIRARRARSPIAK